MRVISGTAKGTKLIAPVGLKTRPTGDRKKEDLFNILAQGIKNKVILDLYCGSGAIGIEALSRGAAKAYFVDSGDKAIESLKANLQKTKLSENAYIINKTVKKAMKLLINIRFDYIFMDPPYSGNEINTTIGLIPDKLNECGIVIIECPSGYIIPDIPQLDIYRIKEYSNMKFVFMKRDERLGCNISGEF